MVKQIFFLSHGILAIVSFGFDTVHSPQLFFSQQLYLATKVHEILGIYLYPSYFNTINLLSKFISETFQFLSLHL